MTNELNGKQVFRRSIIETLDIRRQAAIEVLADIGEIAINEDTPGVKSC